MLNTDNFYIVDSNSKADSMNVVNEAYQFLIKKHMNITNDRKTQKVFRQWHKAGDKAAVVVGVMHNIAATKTARQKKKDAAQVLIHLFTLTDSDYK